MTVSIELRPPKFQKEIDQSQPSDCPREVLGAKTLTQLLNEPDESRGWILPGLVPDTAGLLYAPANGGKSHLAIEIALTVSGVGTALSRAGFRPYRDDLRVAIVAADWGGQKEYRRRFIRFGVTESEDILFVKAPPRDDMWRWVRELTSLGVGLVIVDNFKAIARDTEVNESGQVGAVIQSVLDPILEEGIAVLLVHHTPKGNSATPVGAQDFLGWARWLLQLSNNGLALKAYGNEDAERSYALSYDPDSHRLESVLEGSSQTGDVKQRVGRAGEAGAQSVRDAEAIADALCVGSAVTHYATGTGAAKKLIECGYSKAEKNLRSDIKRAAELLPQRFKVTLKTAAARAWTLDIYPRSTD